MSEPFSQNTSKEITLEALLQLKRFEQPEPEFWEKFDRDLHSKSLKAMICEETPKWSFASLLQQWRLIAPTATLSTLTLMFVISLSNYQDTNTVEFDFVRSPEFFVPVIQQDASPLPNGNQPAIEQNLPAKDSSLSNDLTSPKKTAVMHTENNDSPPPQQASRVSPPPTAHFVLDEITAKSDTNITFTKVMDTTQELSVPQQNGKVVYVADSLPGPDANNSSTSHLDLF